MTRKKRVLSTQVPDQFEKLKGFMGDEVELINIPMIKIEPMEPTTELLDNIKTSLDYNWIVFTSMRGVEHFFILFDKTGLQRKQLSNLKFATIGKSTKSELEKQGFKSNYVNQGSTSKEFARYLVNEVVASTEKVFLALGDLAKETLQEELAEHCELKRVDVYHTIGLRKVPWEVIKIIDADDYDLIVFTSSSAFENFIGITGFHPIMKTLKIASIGTRTNEQIKEDGFEPTITASEPDIETLAKEILEYIGN